LTVDLADDARVNRVGKTAIDEMVLEEIKAAKWLDAGASGKCQAMANSDT
jgi:hypothetical protein